MTEKRFYIAESNLIDGYCVFDRERKYTFSPKPRKADCLNDVHILNELHEENQTFREALQELKEICEYYEGRIQELNEENQKLQERNDRQAKRLDNLYTLIEKQDWKTLQGLIQEFQECEEQ